MYLCVYMLGFSVCMFQCVGFCVCLCVLPECVCVYVCMCVCISADADAGADVVNSSDIDRIDSLFQPPLQA